MNVFTALSGKRLYSSLMNPCGGVHQVRGYSIMLLLSLNRSFSGRLTESFISPVESLLPACFLLVHEYLPIYHPRLHLSRSPGLEHTRAINRSVQCGYDFAVWP